MPDVDAVVHFQDLPVAVLPEFAKSAPLFAYASNSDFVDVPFPDWTYWGNMAHNQPASWQVSIAATAASSACGTRIPSVTCQDEDHVQLNGFLTNAGLRLRS